jgi:hypothetical protein
MENVKRFIGLLLLCLTAQAADINKGYTFLSGDTVTHTKLNNLVGLSSINTAFYTAKSAGSPAVDDLFLYYDSASLVFKKATLSSVFANTNILLNQSEKTAIAGQDLVQIYDSAALSYAKSTVSNIANYAIQRFSTNEVFQIGIHTFAHGLTNTPQVMSAAIRCITNNNGYVVGDELPVESVSQFLNQDRRTFHYGANATNMWYSQEGALECVPTKTNQTVYVDLSNIEWNMILRAQYFP